MKKGLKKILPGTGAVLLVLAGGVMAGAAGKEQEYIFPEVDKELLTEEDVKDLPAELLAYGRYEILAKHGELFESEELKEYFGNQKWYFGFLSDEKEVEGLLNDIEKENLAFLEKKEKAEGGYELDQKDFDYEIVKKWLEGTYVAEKLRTKTHSSGYLQSNFFRLMVAMTRDEPDVEEIEQIISVDATLTYGLLRMANSCYYALRHRVTSVRQAIMTMGLSELRQWVYLLSASNAENQMEEGAEEFLRMSFMRANFCSKLMNYAKDMPISKPDAYLMGMFSTLNYLIDAPLGGDQQLLSMGQP